MRPSGGSLSFDRAAGYYDRTRSNPEHIQRRITELVSEELRDRGRTLEIGVGTGRIALPLREAGIPLVGLDLSRRMLARLVGKAGGWLPFPIVQAEATRLPMRDHAFGAALAVHVLHLVPDWQAVLGELVRVVRPGGVVLIDQGTASGRGWREAVQRRFEREAGLTRRFAGVGHPREIGAAMRALSAVERDLPPVRARVRSAPEQVISELEAGLYSWTWQLDREVRRRAGKAVRAWARDRFGPLDRSRWRGWTIRWQAYDLPT